MPYVNPQARTHIENRMRDTLSIVPLLTPGELHCALALMLREYCEGDHQERGYSRYNAAMGVLACAQQELYRRLIAPYEDQKILENGDVYA